MLYELKKVKIKEMEKGGKYLTEISKRQKEIFQIFGLPLQTFIT